VSINTFDFRTSQVETNNYAGSSTICTQGNGATCINDLNAQPTNEYSSSRTGKASENTCTSSFPTQANSDFKNVQDEHSGLSTNSNTTRAASLPLNTMFEGTRKMKRVAYPSLRKLYQLTASSMPLMSTISEFGVNT